MISIPREVVLEGPSFTPKWKRDMLSAMADAMVRKADAEIFGFPVIVDPLMPKNEIRMRSGSSVARLIVKE